MLSREENERLTRVGPGTPGGELLRRYWQPLCPAAELTAEQPKKRLRIMGEDLVVFRTDSGKYGCVEEHCAHRGVSLYHGFIEGEELRCCYHGWKYDLAGRCTEQPFEPQREGLKDRIRLRAYPVVKLAGLLFTYMGPDPARAPLLPRWDVLVRTDGRRLIQIQPVYKCNWLQCQENTVDSVHTYYLHGEMYLQKKLPDPGGGAAYFHRPIDSYDWKVCQWGIQKTLVYGGGQPEVEVRPPLIFPNILRIPQGQGEYLHWRVPVDDLHTRIIIMGFLPAAQGATAGADQEPQIEYIPDALGADGEYDVTSFYSQDRMAWETQNPIFDRSQEHLGASDRGIVMFRRMLAEQIGRVERGEEPTVAMVRDPAQNHIISFSHTTHEQEPRGSNPSVRTDLTSKR